MRAPANQNGLEPPLREIPSAPWGRTGLAMIVLLFVSLAGWEVYWRYAEDFVPAYRDGMGLWSLTYRRVAEEPVGSIVIIGSSRVLFDMELGVWERETGRSPIQLALAGTNPRPILSHLARETDFAGLLVVGVTPPLFFGPSEGGVFDGAPQYARDESPSQKIGQQISMLIEPHLGFYQPDTALIWIVRRWQGWPARANYAGAPLEPRRLESSRRNRQSDMWRRVENDPEMTRYAQNIWLGFLAAAPPPPPPEIAAQVLDELMAQVAEEVQLIRGRGGEVVFARMPSTGQFREIEALGLPRAVFWDRLLAETGAVGIHFEDHPALQDVRVPEWSHIHSDDTARFTESFIDILRDEFARAGVSRPEMTP